MTPGIKEITVSRGNKTAVFSIAVLDRTASAPADMFYVSARPDKLTYHPGEFVDWKGLEVVEINYDGDPAIPPVADRYIYPNLAIEVSPFDPAIVGKQPITVRKKSDPSKSTSFEVDVADATWYVEAGGEGDGYTLGTPLPSIEAALEGINNAYTRSSCWQNTARESVNIVISGEIDSHYTDFKINGTDYPLLHFKGGPDGGTVLNAVLIDNGNNAKKAPNLAWDWSRDYLEGIAYRDMVSATRGASSVTIEGNSDYYFPSNPRNGFYSFNSVDYPIFNIDEGIYFFYRQRYQVFEDDNYYEGLYTLYYDEVIVNKGAFRDGQNVTLNNFLIAQCETTYDLWYKVWQWATADGRGTDKYTFWNSGHEEYSKYAWYLDYDPSRPLEVPSTAGKYHPVIGVIWMDAIVWCNAYSEMTGKDPVYYTDDACTEVLRISSLEDDSLLPGVVKRKDGANGYRLPTFAEWEYVARGGEPSLNEDAPWMYSYVGVNDSERIGEWVVGVDEVTTMPVKSKKPNYLGLFDIVGNAAEWCWDTEELWGGDPNRVLMGKSISWHWWSSLLYFAKECGFNHNCSTAGFRVVCSPES
jgi:formylglycine-generating enzyme required for sulfatase activity